MPALIVIVVGFAVFWIAFYHVPRIAAIVAVSAILWTSAGEVFVERVLETLPSVLLIGILLLAALVSVVLDVVTFMSTHGGETEGEPDPETSVEEWSGLDDPVQGH